MNMIARHWKDMHDDRRAPKGHVYLARGPHVWAVGLTRSDALRRCRKFARPQDRNRCYAQCLPEDVKVSEIDGYAWWDEQHPHDCEHCERSDDPKQFTKALDPKTKTS